MNLLPSRKRKVQVFNDEIIELHNDRGPKKFHFNATNFMGQLTTGPFARESSVSSIESSSTLKNSRPASPSPRSPTWRRASVSRTTSSASGRSLSSIASVSHIATSSPEPSLSSGTSDGEESNNLESSSDVRCPSSHEESTSDASSKFAIVLQRDLDSNTHKTSTSEDGVDESMFSSARIEATDVLNTPSSAYSSDMNFLPPLSFSSSPGSGCSSPVIGHTVINSPQNPPALTSSNLLTLQSRLDKLLPRLQVVNDALEFEWLNWTLGKRTIEKLRENKNEREENEECVQINLNLGRLEERSREAIRLGHEQKIEGIGFQEKQTYERIAALQEEQRELFEALEENKTEKLVAIEGGEFAWEALTEKYQKQTEVLDEDGKETNGFQGEGGTKNAEPGISTLPDLSLTPGPLPCPRQSSSYSVNGFPWVSGGYSGYHENLRHTQDKVIEAYPLSYVRGKPSDPGAYTGCSAETGHTRNEAIVGSRITPVPASPSRPSPRITYSADVEHTGDEDTESDYESLDCESARSSHAYEPEDSFQNHRAGDPSHDHEPEASSRTCHPLGPYNVRGVHSVLDMARAYRLDNTMGKSPQMGRKGPEIEAVDAIGGAILKEEGDDEGVEECEEWRGGDELSKLLFS